jgi:flagellar basal-body rod protein FlgG
VLEGMYTAAAGMAAQQERLAALSNDLANVNTTGYKRVRVAFRDLVYTPAGPGTAPGIQEGAGAAAQSVGRGAAQGALKRTDRLVTNQGHLTGVTLPRGTADGDVHIAENGTVSVGGRDVGRLDLVTVRANDGLAANGDNTFSITAASGPADGGRVRAVQGALEASNVDIADAMADMIEAQRSFELASRAIRMHDQLLEIANGVKR